MTGGGTLRWAGLVVVALAMGLGRDLLWAWQHSPYDRGGWVVALGWQGLVMAAVPRHGAMPATKVLAAALVVGLLGFVGDLNVAGHVALVIAVVAWVPHWPARLAVAGAGVAWFPALGWLVAQLGMAGGALTWRFAVLLAGVASWWAADAMRRCREGTPA